MKNIRLTKHYKQRFNERIGSDKNYWAMAKEAFRVGASPEYFQHSDFRFYCYLLYLQNKKTDKPRYVRLYENIVFIFVENDTDIAVETCYYFEEKNLKKYLQYNNMMI